MSIKDLRKKRGLTQQELAQKLNLNRSTYANYESENRFPENLYLKLAEHLQVDVKDLTKPIPLTDGEKKRIVLNLEKHISESVANENVLNDEPTPYGQTDYVSTLIYQAEYLINRNIQLEKKYEQLKELYSATKQIMEEQKKIIAKKS